MKHCLISKGLVVNVVLWDGVQPCDFGDVDVVAVNDDEYVGPGFTYDGKKFTPPEPDK